MNIIDVFRDFHRTPELSNQEYETTRKIREYLECENIEILSLPLQTGLAARISGSLEGRTIAFRADIDALPITEETTLPYKSVNSGVMHACGHDIHICTALETAKRIKQHQSELHGTVIFIFQPAEESAFGAKQIIDTGILKNIDVIVSLHCNPSMRVGTLGIKSGAITAAVDIIKLTVTGKGTHGAKPEQGYDPIVASAALIQSLQAIVSRNISPLKSAVVSITHIEGGKNYNIIPDSVFMEGTIRTADKETRKLVREKVLQHIHAIELMYDVTVSLKWLDGPPATNNASDLAQLAWNTALEADLQPIVPDLSMVGEDFAFYQEVCKEIMVWLGVGEGQPLHSPCFQADSHVLELAPQYFEKFLLKILHGE